MALIQCVECKKEISDQAASCPGCGTPLRAQHAGSQSVTTTRGGAKFEAAGFMAILVGIGLLVGGYGPFGGWLLLAGFVVFIIGRFN